MSALIEAREVCKSFGGLQALTDCSLQVREGSITGLIGPNGSGKTTLFNVMTGFERCSAGEIRPAGNLSYGQRKLLELASLLVADPAVLLLDEPTAGVNPTLINQLSERIRELNRAGKTFLVVEHNMEFVMGLCHEVTVLHQGRTLKTGTPEQVRADPAVLDAYLGGADDDDV